MRLDSSIWRYLGRFRQTFLKEFLCHRLIESKSPLKVSAIIMGPLNLLSLLGVFLRAMRSRQKLSLEQWALWLLTDSLLLFLLTIFSFPKGFMFRHFIRQCFFFFFIKKSRESALKVVFELWRGF